MALSADRKLRAAYPGQGYRADLPAVADTYYAGAIVSVGSTGGRLKVAGTANNDRPMGIVLENTVVATADIDKVRVPILMRSRVWFPVSTALAVFGSIGDVFTTTDDEVIATWATSKGILGICVDFNSERNELLIDMGFTA